MKSFELSLLKSQAISPSLLQTIRLLGEYKGKQELFQRQSPQILENLRRQSIIQSTQSSNRIEGVEAPLMRIKSLIEDKSPPQNRSEQEIAGYKNVLNTIHSNWREMEFSSNLVLQLHRDLYQYLPGHGGFWKKTENKIEEETPDGAKRTRFEPVAPYLTPIYMEELHNRFQTIRLNNQFEPLLLIATYLMDFLCIHPFPDGNGRMARLIALLLLYQEGYTAGKYISLEAVIENTKDQYYETLFRSDQGWHESRHNLTPWWEYFLGVVLVGAYRQFEERAGIISSKKGAQSASVRSVISNLPTQFSIGDIENACPQVGHATIQRVLRQMRDEGKICLVQAGRNAFWEKQPSRP